MLQDLELWICFLFKGTEYYMREHVTFTSFLAISLSVAFKSWMLISFNTTSESSSFLRYNVAVPYDPANKHPGKLMETYRDIEQFRSFHGVGEHLLSSETFAILHHNNKGRFCNNSAIDTLLSKWLSVENKAKFSQLTRPDFVTIAKLTH